MCTSTVSTALMLQIETLMVGSEDTLHTGTVTLTPAPRGDRELDTAQTHDPRCRYSVLYSTLSIIIYSLNR